MTRSLQAWWRQRRARVWLAACGLVLATGRVSVATTLTLEDYRRSLDALGTALDDSRAMPPLPDSWRVRIDGREFVVTTAALRRDLDTWRVRHDPSTRARLLRQIDALRSEAFDAARPSIDRRTEHQRLAAILASPEFRRVAAPTWWDRLKQTALDWLLWLVTLPLTSSAIPTLGRLVIYALIATAVLLLAWTAYRYIESVERVDTALAVPIAPSREWQQWLADGRAAAERGAWRDAVHFTYWCAVSFLEARGSWRPDHTRTPREYLRLLPAASHERAPLVELTTGFERVWYGKAEADAQTYERAMTHLRTIGCPLP